MKSIFKKIAFVLALAMVVTAFPAKTAAAASEPTLKAKRTLYIGGDATEQYAESAWASVKKGDYSVKFASADEKIATVNAKNGRIHAVSVGETVVTATFSKDGAKDIVKECAVKVKQNAGAVELDEKSAEMTVGEKITVKATAENENTTDKLHFAPKAAADKEIIDVDYDNGEITAKAAGTATVLVYATQWEYNKDTKKWAKKVTTDKVEFTVTVKETGVLSAKQTSLNTITLTVADAASAKAIKATDVKVVYYLGDKPIDDLIESVKVDTKDDTKVNVSLYNNIAKDQNYKVTVADKEFTFVGAKQDVAYIQITSTELEYNKEQNLKVALYNADGVDVTTPAELTKVSFSAAEYVTENYYLNGSKLFFFNKNKSVKVTATYDTGYNNKGEKNEDIKDTKEIVSVEPAQAVNSTITGWSIGTASADTKKLTYTDSVNIAVGDNGNYYLYGKYTKTTNGKTEDAYAAGAGFSYESSNPKALLVSGHQLLPIAAGAASVIVKDGNNKVVGVCNVVVANERILSEFDVKPNKTTLSTGEDTIELTVTAKDQFGVDMPVSNITVAQVNDAATPYTNIGTVAVTNGKASLTASANATTTAKAANLKITLKIGTVEKVRNILVNVKAPSTTIGRYELNLSKTELDTKLITDGVYASTITLRTFDNAGYRMADSTITKLVANSTGLDITKLGSDGQFVVVVTNNAETNLNNFVDDVTKNFVAVSGTSVTTKASVGNYVITAYKITGTTTKTAQVVASTVLAVKDSTTPVTATKKGEIGTIKDYEKDNLKDTVIKELNKSSVLELKRGNDAATGVAVVDYEVSNSATTNSLYITKVTLEETVAGHTFQWKVPVNALFSYEVKYAEKPTVTPDSATSGAVKVSLTNTDFAEIKWKEAGKLTITVSGSSLEYRVKVASGTENAWKTLTENENLDIIGVPGYVADQNLVIEVRNKAVPANYVPSPSVKVILLPYKTE